VALGGSALVVSLLARAKVSGHLTKGASIKMESEALT
jgi:hypothetical protein